MNMDELITTARQRLIQLTGYKDANVTGATKSDEGWLVTVEVVERKGLPDTMDLLGKYEVRMSEDGQLQGFSRVAMRKRIDVSSVE